MYSVNIQNREIEKLSSNFAPLRSKAERMLKPWNTADMLLLEAETFPPLKQNYDKYKFVFLRRRKTP